MVSRTKYHILMMVLGLWTLNIVSTSPATAGDFSNPSPISLSTDRAYRTAIENSRLSLNTRLVAPQQVSNLNPYYQLGEYYERYQANSNWINPVLSGNTIILNGDNNQVVLSMDGATVEQNATDVCQTGTAEILEENNLPSSASSVNCEAQ